MGGKRRFALPVDAAARGDWRCPPAPCQHRGLHSGGGRPMRDAGIRLGTGAEAWRAPGTGGEIGRGGAVENGWHCSEIERGESCFGCAIILLERIVLNRTFFVFRHSIDYSESYFLCVLSLNF